LVLPGKVERRKKSGGRVIEKRDEEGEGRRRPN